MSHPLEMPFSRPCRHNCEPTPTVQAQSPDWSHWRFHYSLSGGGGCGCSQDLFGGVARRTWRRSSLA